MCLLQVDDSIPFPGPCYTHTDHWIANDPSIQVSSGGLPRRTRCCRQDDHWVISILFFFFHTRPRPVCRHNWKDRQFAPHPHPPWMLFIYHFWLNLLLCNYYLLPTTTSFLFWRIVMLRCFFQSLLYLSVSEHSLRAIKLRCGLTNCHIG